METFSYTYTVGGLLGSATNSEDRYSLEYDAAGRAPARRELVMKLAKDYPIRLICRLLDAPRSSVYYAAQPAPDGEAMLKSVLLDLAGKWPTYRDRLTALMRRLGFATE